MSALRPDPHFFRTSQNSMAADVKCYVPRQADEDLYDALLRGEYCNVMSSRRVGKSALLVRANDRLKRDSKGVLIAVGSPGREKESNAWHKGLARSIYDASAGQMDDFKIPTDWGSEWDAEAWMSPAANLVRFVEKHLLDARPDIHWIIAFDEIDDVPEAEFTDDFFLAMRDCMSRQSSHPKWRRLSVVLVGVTAPSKLIKSQRRPPYNIGTNIVLTDLTAEETASRLLEGLGVEEEARKADHPAVKAILEWTSGHPFLTQVVFRQLATQLNEGSQSHDEEAWRSAAKEAVDKEVFRLGSDAREHLLEDDRRWKTMPVRQCRRVLLTYRRALRGKPVCDDPLSPITLELKLNGLLAPDPKRPGYLVVRNQVFREFYNEQWINERLPPDKRQYWITGVTAFLLFMVGFGWWWQTEVNRRQAEDRRQKADSLAKSISSEPTDTVPKAYQELRDMGSSFESLAASSLADYWSSAAQRLAFSHGRDYASMAALKALSLAPNSEADLLVRRARSGAWPWLLHTFYPSPSDEGKAALVEMHADGKQVLASVGNVARQWDVKDGHSVGVPMLHDEGSTITRLHYIQHGTRIITAGTDRTVRIWDAASGIPVGERIRVLDDIKELSIAPDGSRIVVETLNDELDPAVRKLLAELGLNAENIPASGKNGRLTVEDVKVFDAKKRAAAAPAKAVGSPIAGRVEERIKGQHRLTLWDTATGERITPKDGLVIEQDAVFAISPDLLRVAVASSRPKEFAQKDGKSLGRKLAVTITNLATGEQEPTPLLHYVGNDTNWRLSWVGFAMDGTRLLTRSYRGDVSLWKVAPAEPLCRVDDHYQERRFTGGEAPVLRTDSLLVTKTNKGELQFRSLDSGYLLGQVHTEHGFSNVALSKDGAFVYLREPEEVSQWSTSTFNKVATFPMALYDDYSDSGHDGNAAGSLMAWHDPGDDLLRMPVFDPASGKLRLGSRYHLLSVAVDARQRRLVQGMGWLSQAQVWDLENGQLMGLPVTTAAGGSRAEPRVSFALDGECVVTNPADGSVRVWQVNTEQPTLGESRPAPLRLSFNAARGRLLEVYKDRAVLRDAVSMKQLGEPIELKQFENVSFSESGNRVEAFGSERLGQWSAVTGEKLGNGWQRLQDLDFTRRFGDSPTISPSGATVMVKRGSFEAWDAHTGQKLLGLSEQLAEYSTQLFSDARRVLMWKPSGIVIVGDRYGQEQVRHQFDGVLDKVELITDETVALVRGSGKGWLWDTATGQVRGEPLSVSETSETKWDSTVKRLLVQDEEQVQLIDTDSSRLVASWAVGKDTWAFSPHGFYLHAVSKSDGSSTIHLRRASDGAELASRDAGKPNFAFVSNKDNLWTAPDEAHVLWNMATQERHVLGIKVRDIKRFESESIDRVAVESDSTIAVWDLATCKQLAKFKGPGEPPWVNEWSADGSRLLVRKITDPFAAKPEELKIFDATSGLAVSGRELASSIFGQLTPDGSYLTDKQQAWQVSTGKPLVTKALGPNSRCELSPSLQHFVVLQGVPPPPPLDPFAPLPKLTKPTTLECYDTHSQKPVGKLNTCAGLVINIDWVEKSEVFLAQYDNATSQLWNSATGEPLGRAIPSDVVDRVWLPEWKRWMLMFTSGSLMLIDTETGAALGWDSALGRVKLSGPKFGSDFAFSPDGSRFFTCDKDGRSRCWDSRTGEPMGQEWSCRIGSLTWSADSKALAVDVSNYRPGGFIRFYSPSGEMLSQWPEIGGAKEIHFTPDETQIASINSDSSVTIRRMDTGELVGRPLRHAQDVTLAIFSPDGASVLTAAEDMTAQMWESATGRKIGSAMKHRKEVNKALFCLQGSRVFTELDDKTLTEWDTKTGLASGAMMQHKDDIEEFRLSPNESRLVSWTERDLHIWDVATGRPVGQPISCEVSNVVFSHDSTLMAVRAKDFVQLWDLGKGESRSERLAPAEALHEMLFSQDDQCLIASGESSLHWLCRDRTTGQFEVKDTIWSCSGPFAYGTLLLDPSGHRVRVCESQADGLDRWREVELGKAEPGLPPLPDSAKRLLQRCVETTGLRFENEVSSRRMSPKEQ